ncbi:MAG: LysM peptidoglycan-binding domain-containing protein [Candidatus Sericytochromatia bacterium]|nr:LysM peptidoglycan-binding domain-containing protein [Candidatus Sericytochromatia bacterium]
MATAHLMLIDSGRLSARKLRAPSAQGHERPGRGPAFAYVLQPHDTLYAVARASGVPLAELMRRNPSIQGATPRAGERLWIPDLLPASAGDPVSTLSARVAAGGEIRISPDRRYVAVLDASLADRPNAVTVYERKAARRMLVPLSAPHYVWKRLSWTPDGYLLAIEGSRQTRDPEGGVLSAFDPATADKGVLLTATMALEDLEEEGFEPVSAEVVGFRPVKRRIQYRLAFVEHGERQIRQSDWDVDLDSGLRRRL